MKCYHCEKELPVTEFYKDKSKSSGYKPRCKKCDRLSMDTANRRSYEKKYRQQHPEKRSKIVRKSMNGNKEHHRKQRKIYLQTDSGRASYKKYTQKRYSLTKQAFIEDVNIHQLYIESGGECFYCKQELLFSEIHVDHYIPISRGGKHEKSNLRIACAYCNLSKGAKLPEELTYQVV